MKSHHAHVITSAIDGSDHDHKNNNVFAINIFNNPAADAIENDWMSLPSFDRRESDYWMKSNSSSNLNPYAQPYCSYLSQPDYYSSFQQQQQRSWSQAYSNDGTGPVLATHTPPPQATHHRALSTSTASTSSPQQRYSLHPQAFLDSNHYRHLQPTQYYPTPIHTPTSATFMEQSHGRNGAPALPPQASQPQLKPYPPQIQTSAPQYVPHPQQQYNPGYLTPHSATSRTKTPISANADFASRPYPGQLPQLQQQPQYAQQQKTPHLEHSMTQVCADEGYNPLMAPQSAQPTQHPSTFSMPDSMKDRLHAANAQRQASTPFDIKRETSPYKPDSVLLREDSNYNRHPSGPSGQVGTYAEQRQQAKFAEDQYQFWRHHTRGEDPTQKPETISPREALIDSFKEPTEDAANGAPLFPQRSNSSSQQQLFDPRHSYGPVGASRPFPPSSTFSFQTPGMPASANVPTAMPPGSADYKFAPLARAESSNEDTPAHLVSMETSKSEPSSSQEALPQRTTPRDLSSTPTSARPSGSISTADTGTYSCTYVGCPKRFPTPSLLQKHKKDAHRPAPGIGPRHGAAAVPAGQAGPVTDTRSLSPRNSDTQAMSQAGPHRCDRINPSTGKPCNTVFSRPYDLTRHEDTIHASKPKVHCQYCQARGEEKTFSRNDALTRHLRVVHPEIEVRGLHGRRRGL